MGVIVTPAELATTTKPKAAPAKTILPSSVAQGQGPSPTQGRPNQGYVAQQQTLANRALLIKHGYNVAPTGVATPRFMQALAHFQATKGGGAAVWNAHNDKVVGGGRVAPAKTTTLPNVNIGNGDPTGFTGDDVSGAPTTASMNALLAKLAAEFHPYTGDQGQPAEIDAANLGATQAGQQFDPAITQQQTDITNMLGAEPGAQQNISKYFAPVKATAAANVASDDAANAANVAATAKLSPSLAQALGLSGATAGGLTASGDNATAFAQNQAANQHAQDTADQSAADRNEQQAHTTEDSNNTIALSGARANLISQMAQKGQAQVTDTAADTQQNFTNRTQGIANKATISNINATNALAGQNVLGTTLDNDLKAQQLQQNKVTNARTNATTTDALKSAAQTRAENLATTKAQLQSATVNLKRLTQTPIPGSTNFHQTPFYALPQSTLDSISNTMWTAASKYPPAKAQQIMQQYLTGTMQYTSTPATRKFVAAEMAKHKYDASSKKWLS